MKNDPTYMEGTSLAGSRVSIAYVAKEIEHVCTNSTVGPSAAEWTKEAYVVHGSCNALKPVSGVSLHDPLFKNYLERPVPLVRISSENICSVLLLSRKEAKSRYAKQYVYNLHVQLIFALGGCFLIQLNFTWWILILK